MPEDTHFLFDHRFQAHWRNVRTVCAPTRKFPGNPLTVDGRKQWYGAGGRPNNMFGVIRYFPDQRLYRGSITRHPGIASSDGIAWQSTEPWLGRFEVEGDPDTDPGRIYKRFVHICGSGDACRMNAEAIARCKSLGVEPVPGMGVAWSADGEHWTYRHPVVRQDRKLHTYMSNDWGGGDGYNHVIWAPTLNRYVAFMRTNIDRQRWGGRKERSIGRIESEDFVEWTQHEVVLRPWTDWHHQLGYPKHDFYMLPVSFHKGIYLGIVAVFQWPTDTVHMELAWSADTIHWERIAPLEDFIEQGQDREHDSGCCFGCHGPVFLDDEVRWYYGSSSGRHNREPDRDGYLCLATTGKERIAGAASFSRQHGLVVTKPLDVAGKALHLNADASFGAVRVEARDERGQAVDGFGFMDCAPVTGDVLDANVHWRGAAGLPTGRAVLAFAIEQATLYALRFG